MSDNKVYLDMEHAVLLDGLEVSLVNAHAPEPVTRLAVRMDGRLNQSDERSCVLYLMDEDGAAAVVTEIVALAARIGPEFAERFQLRLEKLAEEGHMTSDPSVP